MLGPWDTTEEEIYDAINSKKTLASAETGRKNKRQDFLQQNDQLTTIVGRQRNSSV